jgi:hypothetical protein
MMYLLRSTRGDWLLPFSFQRAHRAPTHTVLVTTTSPCVRLVVIVTHRLPCFPSEPCTAFDMLWAPLHTCRPVTIFFTRHHTSRPRFFFRKTLANSPVLNHYSCWRCAPSPLPSAMHASIGRPSQQLTSSDRTRSVRPSWTHVQSREGGAVIRVNALYIGCTSATISTKQHALASSTIHCDPLSVKYTARACETPMGIRPRYRRALRPTVRHSSFVYFSLFPDCPTYGAETRHCHPQLRWRRGQSERLSASPSCAASETPSDIVTTQSVLGTIMTHLTEFHTKLASLEHTRKPRDQAPTPDEPSHPLFKTLLARIM